MTSRDATQRDDQAVDVGMAMARKIFEKRGNHSEIHLSEGELAGLLGAAYAANAAPSADGVASDAIAFDLKMTLHALLDRDITFDGRNAVLPFESHDQAINHIAEARRKGKP